MNNNISFFVSSTFKDMQGERDSLHRYVIPSIREFASDYGRNVDFIDLRWGISTDDLDTDVSTDKILNVCLDEIEQCSPYQIVILGERYGWIPSTEILKNTADKKQFILDGDKISVTELEIQYGLWVNQHQLDKCIFCFREVANINHLSEEEQQLYISNDIEDMERMRVLKNKIMNTPDVHIINYELDFQKEINRYDDFVDKLNLEIKHILTATWGNQRRVSWLTHESENELMISNRMNERFSGREATLKEIEYYITAGTLILDGYDGCGLTSLMARLGLRLKEKGHIVKNIYCGNGYCADTEQLLKIMVSQFEEASLEEEFQLTTPEYGNVDYWKDKWDQVASNYNGAKVYLLIDGIHHLSPDNALLNSYFLPSKGISPDLKIVITKNLNMAIDPIAVEKMNSSCYFLTIDECEKDELRSIISSRLKSDHKQIGENVMTALLEHPLTHNMICMELILQDILNLDHEDFSKIHKLEETMGGNDAISHYLCEIIREHPKTESALINYWMERSLQILAEHNNEEYHYLYYMMACMTLSANGLSSEELSDMADYIRTSGRAQGKIWNNWWAEVRFSKFRRYMGNMIIKTSEGRYKFAHEQIRSALFAQTIMSSLVAGPMVYFQSLPDDSDLKQDNLLASYLLYLTNNKSAESNMDTYFFKHVENAFLLVNDSDPEKSKEGNRRIKRMIYGLRNIFLYSSGEKSVECLCKILTLKAQTGLSIRESVIDTFLFRLSLILNNKSIYEKSIMLCCYIAVAKGYEIWEGENGRPKRGKHKHDIGIYKDWTEVERRLLTRIYAEICDYYHEVSCYLDSTERTMSIPWDWDKIRTNAGLYIDVFDVNNIFRGKFCNKVILIDADNNLDDNYTYSFKLIENSKNFNNSILHRPFKNNDELNRIIIKNYFHSMLNTSESYVRLASYISDKESEQVIERLHFESKWVVGHAFRRLKRKKLIKNHYDLDPLLRLRYMKQRNYTDFLYYKDKQSYVDDMWELYQNARQDEFLHDRVCRDEVLNIAMLLMEYALDGYMPSEFITQGKSIRDFALKLQHYEYSYMCSRGYTYKYSENIYIVYILRAMFIIIDQESNPEAAKQECKNSLETLEYFLSSWKNQSNDYVIKCRNLLRWYKEFLKNH